LHFKAKSISMGLGIARGPNSPRLLIRLKNHLRGLKRIVKKKLVECNKSLCKPIYYTGGHTKQGLTGFFSSIFTQNRAKRLPFSNHEISHFSLDVFDVFRA